MFFDNKFNFMDSYLVLKLIKLFLTNVLNLIGLVLVLSGIIYLTNFVYIISKEPYFRSEEGSILNQKIEGLRKYIKHFTRLNKKEHKHIVFWKDYLMYSVLLCNNKTLEKEILNKVSLK